MQRTTPSRMRIAAFWAFDYLLARGRVRCTTFWVNKRRPYDFANAPDDIVRIYYQALPGEELAVRQLRAINSKVLLGWIENPQTPYYCGVADFLYHSLTVAGIQREIPDDTLPQAISLLKKRGNTGYAEVFQAFYDLDRTRHRLIGYSRDSSETLSPRHRMADWLSNIALSPHLRSFRLDRMPTNLLSMLDDACNTIYREKLRCGRCNEDGVIIRASLPPDCGFLTSGIPLA